MKKALVISFSDLAKDPRVSRQIKWLISMGYSITTIACSAPNMSVEQHFTLTTPKNRPFKKWIRGFYLLAGLYRRYIWSHPKTKHFSNIFACCTKEPFDVIVVNDMDPLPVVDRYRGKAKVLVDAHEWAPEEFSDRFLWRLMVQNYRFYLCRTYLPKMNGLIAVGERIAQRYAEVFSLPMPMVVTNAGPYFQLKASKVEENKIRLIYHGMAMKSRSIEVILELFEHLDSRFYMDLILVSGDKKYIEKIKTKKQKRLRFLDPVPMNEIVPFTNQYDIGVFLLPPVNFNYLNALPNKLFEFIQARLAVAIGPSPAMQKIVESYECGVVSDDFEPASLAEKLNGLSQGEIQFMKEKAHAAAGVLNAEANRAVFEEALLKL